MNNELELDKTNFPTALLNTLIELHAKQDAQTNLLVDFLASISNKPRQELMDSINIRTQLSKEAIVKKMYSEFGSMPDDLKNLFDGAK